MSGVDQTQYQSQTQARAESARTAFVYRTRCRVRWLAFLGAAAHMLIVLLVPRALDYPAWSIVVAPFAIPLLAAWLSATCKWTPREVCAGVCTGVCELLRCNFVFCDNEQAIPITAMMLLAVVGMGGGVPLLAFHQNGYDWYLAFAITANAVIACLVAVHSVMHHTHRAIEGYDSRVQWDRLEASLPR